MANDVAIYSGSNVRGSGDKTSCNLTMRVISLGRETRPTLGASFLDFSSLPVLIACSM